MKYLLWIVGIVAVLIGAFYALNSYIYNEKQAGVADYKDATYLIEGEPVTLEDGVSETEEATTRHFGNELKTDLNGDGREDVVFLVTQETGGSGTFFYVLAALDTEYGFVGSDAYFLGDRIAPQSTNESQNPQHKGVIVVNYADRAPGEPMSAQPSVGKSAYLKLDEQSMMWGVVDGNFAGEADPSRMTLTMKEWVWESALYNDGREILPLRERVFTLTFGADGNFAAKTDCNSMSGSYTARDGNITFGPIAMTKMFCQGSQEMEFAKLLETTSGYHFTARGQLILDLKFDSGSAVFR